MSDPQLSGLYHQHLLVKAFVTKPPTDPVYLSVWLADMVHRVGMKILMGPYCTYSLEVGNRGITGIVVLNTSHCSIHVFDEPSPALVQMDLYSCRAFEPKQVIEALNEFGPQSVDDMLVMRNDRLKVA